jgi:ribosome-associated translation inhibitor RaiA
MELRVEGADKFGKLAKALRQAGAKDLQKELYSAINRATKPMRAEARKSAEQNLPQAGGLNKRVARARMSTRRRAGRDPGVKIVAKGMDQLGLMDRGRVRHPVYGNRARWVNQPIPDAKDWFTKPMEEGAEEVRTEILAAVDEIAKKIERKL